jgi:hypothetical protein
MIIDHPATGVCMFRMGGYDWNVEVRELTMGGGVVT